MKVKDLELRKEILKIIKEESWVFLVKYNPVTAFVYPNKKVTIQIKRKSRDYECNIAIFSGAKKNWDFDATVAESLWKKKLDEWKLKTQDDSDAELRKVLQLTNI